MVVAIGRCIVVNLIIKVIIIVIAGIIQITQANYCSILLKS